MPPQDLHTNFGQISSKLVESHRPSNRITHRSLSLLPMVR